MQSSIPFYQWLRDQYGFGPNEIFALVRCGANINNRNLKWYSQQFLDSLP